MTKSEVRWLESSTDAPRPARSNNRRLTGGQCTQVVVRDKIRDEHANNLSTRRGRHLVGRTSHNGHVTYGLLCLRGRPGQTASLASALTASSSTITIPLPAILPPWASSIYTLLSNCLKVNGQQLKLTRCGISRRPWKAFVFTEMLCSATRSSMRLASSGELMREPWTRTSRKTSSAKGMSTVSGYQNWSASALNSFAVDGPEQSGPSSRASL